MATALRAPAAPTVCAHLWMIASPNGKTSSGRCRHCGTEQEFHNSIEDERRANNNDVFPSNYGRGRRDNVEFTDFSEVDASLRSMYRSR